MYICIYINIYIYRRANGIYIQKSCSIWTVCPCSLQYSIYEWFDRLIVDIVTNCIEHEAYLLLLSLNTICEDVLFFLKHANTILSFYCDFKRLLYTRVFHKNLSFLVREEAFLMGLFREKFL